MSNRVNLLVDPNRNDDELVYPAGDADAEVASELTATVRDTADLDTYLEKVYDRSDPDTHFIGTVREDNGNYADVRIAERVTSNVRM